VVAELAHEIRNRLVGIQMAFNNLRRGIDDVVQLERLGGRKYDRTGAFIRGRIKRQG
jgi:nitrogen-specific signal transduction histidine kinase